MRKFNFCIVLFLLSINCALGQQYRKSVKPVKNVILMIPDGTSTSVLSIARWYQMYNGGSDLLNLDPYLCGLVKTYSSNSPIPDSAPAMSAYMTGVPARKGNLSIYPETDQDQDIYPIDTMLANQPLITVFEAARLIKNKSTGIVVTTDFCHATPAGCTTHHYDRKAYSSLASQMAYSNLDVVFGGGFSVVTDEIKEYFKRKNTTFIGKNLTTFREFSGNNPVWALFADRDMSYDLDRNPEKQPSLSEMTKKAIDLLDEKENGFFLMIEGSRVDMAAHANDPIGIIREFLAFDKAVGVAIDYAKKNGETAVVILPDHGNSGINFGSKKFLNYSEKGLKYTFDNISKYRKTAKGLEVVLLKTKPENIRAVFKEYTNIDLTQDEEKQLLASKNYKEYDYTQVGSTENMVSSIAKIMTSRTYFDFVSGSHTGEDVFLAAYHPNGDIPTGLNTNIEINKYLCDLVGLDKVLMQYTNNFFVKHTDLFKGDEYSIEDRNVPTLIVKKGNDQLIIPAYSSIILINNKPVDIGSLILYSDKTKFFYLPEITLWPHPPLAIQ